MAKRIDRERDRLLDQQRALFRFLSKSARKGEPADPEAAAARIEAELDDLPDFAAQVQARIDDAWPDAPRLISLLDDPDPETLAAAAAYDWVQTGIYSFGLPPTKTRSGSAESAAHRALKEWAAAHPEQALAPPGATAITERWFPSGDESDVAFLADNAATIVEVRPAETEPHELRRALFALVKLRAVLEAEDALASRPREVAALLLTAAPVTPDLQTLASHLNLQILPAQPHTH